MTPTVDLLHRITSNTGMADRKAALLKRIEAHGGPLNEPAIFAQALAQVLHESGAFRYVREVWGPTAAQARYEGRADLGNTHAGDGKRFMGRDMLQVTGRANYRAMTAWVRANLTSTCPDFEANPSALEGPEWLGIGVIWYFRTRPKLIGYCRDGNIEMVTRGVNGGLNGYADRLQWYDRTALAMLEEPSIKAFQKSAGLIVDGISGPKTRAALHAELAKIGAPPVVVTAPTSNPVVVSETPFGEHQTGSGLTWLLNFFSNRQ